MVKSEIIIYSQNTLIWLIYFSDITLERIQSELRASGDQYSNVTRKPWEDDDFIPIDDIFINLEMAERQEYRATASTKSYAHYSELFTDESNTSSRLVSPPPCR